MAILPLNYWSEITDRLGYKGILLGVAVGTGVLLSLLVALAPNVVTLVMILLANVALSLAYSAPIMIEKIQEEVKSLRTSTSNTPSPNLQVFVGSSIVRIGICAGLAIVGTLLGWLLGALLVIPMIRGGVAGLFGAAAVIFLEPITTILAKKLFKLS